MRREDLSCVIANTGTFPYGHLIAPSSILQTIHLPLEKASGFSVVSCSVVKTASIIYTDTSTKLFPLVSVLKRFDCVLFLDISEDDDYLESNKMHGINGFLYANLPGLELCIGDKVSWHLIGLGNEVDMHTAYFYGNTFTYNGNMKDTVSLLPGNIDKTQKGF